MQRLLMLAQATVTCLLLVACSSGGSTNPAPIVAQTSMRIVNGTAYGLTPASPGSANRVDVYVYPTGTARPTQPAFSGIQYFNVSPYQSFATGTYQVDVFDRGSTQGAPVLAETVNLSAQNNYSIVVAGERPGVYGNSPLTLQLVNFIEPTLVPGQSAVVFHQASPYLPNIGVGIIPPGVNPYGNSFPQLFTLSLQATSGPATVGNSSGGEYWIGPANLTMPTIGFAVGVPGSGGPPQPSVYASAYAGFPFIQGNHLSVFVIDNWGLDASHLVGVIAGTDP